MVGRFFQTVKKKPFIYVYFFLVVLSVSLLLRFIPVADMATGLFALTGSNPLVFVVAFAQWLTAPDMLSRTLLFIPLASIALALVCTLAFSGALGVFSLAADIVGGFPSKRGMGFVAGYSKNFLRVFALFSASLAITLLLLFAWIIAAIPLAIISEMVTREIVSSTILYVIVAITGLIVYVGFTFTRVFTLSFLPAFYSGTYRTVGAAFSFAGRGFFNMAWRILPADALLTILLILYYVTGKNIILIFVNSSFCTFIVPWLLFVVFENYTLDGYGFDEINEIDERELIGSRARGPERGGRELGQELESRGRRGVTYKAGYAFETVPGNRRTQDNYSSEENQKPAWEVVNPEAVGGDETTAFEIVNTRRDNTGVGGFEEVKKD